MSYPSVLPQVFPYIMSVPTYKAVQIAEVLTAPRPTAPNGSSFAMTSDGKHGQVKVWMSEVSYKTIKENHAVLIHRGTEIEWPLDPDDKLVPLEPGDEPEYDDDPQPGDSA